MDNKHFKAEKGMTYQRVVDGYRMGDELFLNKFIDGTDDVIENYVQVEKTEEEIAEDNRRNEMLKSYVKNNRRVKSVLPEDGEL